MNEQELQRLNRVERAVWWWRRATMLSLSIMGAIILMGQTLPPPRVIEIEKLSLRDANGKIRAMLFTTPDGSPTLTMADKEGEPRIQMIVGRDGTPVIGLQDKKDILRAMLTIAAGHPSFSLYDKDGGQRSKLSVDEKGSPALAFWDKGVQDKGIKPRIMLTLGPDGSPRLGLGGKDGETSHCAGCGGRAIQPWFL